MDNLKVRLARYDDQRRMTLLTELQEERVNLATIEANLNALWVQGGALVAADRDHSPGMTVTVARTAPDRTIGVIDATAEIALLPGDVVTVSFNGTKSVASNGKAD